MNDKPKEAIDRIVELEDALSTALAIQARLYHVVHFYADERMWMLGPDGQSTATTDRGKKARLVLSQESVSRVNDVLQRVNELERQLECAVKALEDISHISNGFGSIGQLRICEKALAKIQGAGLDKINGGK